MCYELVNSRSLHYTIIITRHNWPIEYLYDQIQTKRDQMDTWNAAKWLSNDLVLGQVGGIAVDKNDTVYIFHRGNHLWTSSSFGQADNVYTEQYNGAINESTIIMVDKNGRVMKKLGEHMFYLPHGITVDSDFNIWVTDVALHQVMKFKPASNDAVLVKGKRFVPGKDSNHFCKPTSVAVLQNGDFFVADGYCNSRIVKFDSNGKKILEWGRSTVRHHGMRIPGPGEFFIPHALALNSDESLLCVADRENGRVQCFHPSNGTYSSLLSKLPFPLRTVYSIAYSNFGGGSFVLVNGPRMFNDLVQGFVVSPSGRWIGSFGSNKLNAPHDLAVSADGSAIYVAEITVSGPRAWKFVHSKYPISLPLLEGGSERLGLLRLSAKEPTPGTVVLLLNLTHFSRMKKEDTPTMVNLTRNLTICSTLIWAGLKQSRIQDFKLGRKNAQNVNHF
ncbi:unnamed protein product [Nesidiocoris tenuis]|uniref:peptidylamidoglycolate lyase n=1 Tax=Nesidiocoris tenuis TaxID=355587 RepID=A0A6H5FVM5_9HEMI|nr:unnamed protein product [Nesidiocoris tenuis]CAA9993192.1 unnamed protein product [Nesidiocoris tenuis]